MTIITKIIWIVNNLRINICHGNPKKKKMLKKVITFQIYLLAPKI